MTLLLIALVAALTAGALVLGYVTGERAGQLAYQRLLEASAHDRQRVGALETMIDELRARELAVVPPAAPEAVQPPALPVEVRSYLEGLEDGVAREEAEEYAVFLARTGLEESSIISKLM